MCISFIKYKLFSQCNVADGYVALLLLMLPQPLYVAVAAAEINICTQNAIFQAFPLLFGGPGAMSWVLSLVRADVASRTCWVPIFFLPWCLLQSQPETPDAWQPFILHFPFSSVGNAASRK